MSQAHNILRHYWGYTSFRPLQAEIIEDILNQKDVVALMPTGGGKSICFQIPALLLPGVTLVVTPLIALMQDQVRQLQARHIPAAALHAGMHPAHITQILEKAMYGKLKLLYLSPERLKTTSFLERLPHINVTLLAIDEAHCISEWGYDFRPAYLEIPAIKKHLPPCPTVAVTATATPHVRQDMQQKLHMRSPAWHIGSFARKNLAYVVRHSPNKYRDLLNILRKVSGSTIIYASTRGETEKIARRLQQDRIRADFYHAGLDTDIRHQKQQAWMQEAQRVIVATNAFGMGINKENVRLVIHLSPPPTLEAYYQEAGRAGRDQQKAYGVLLYNKQDFTTLINNVEANYLPPEHLKMLYQLLANYHQVAVGSHAGISYEMDIDHFAVTYEWSLKKVRSGLQQLEGAGFIYMDHQPTDQVHILLQGNDLYHFQIANKASGDLLRTMIHLYDKKIFDTPCMISIKRVAQIHQIAPRNLRKLLTSLAQLKVIHYIPASKPTQLTFLTPRYTLDKLPLAKTKKRKQQMLNKAHAIIHYAQHQHRCRTQLLLEYFGEVTYTPCQLCDTCLSRKKKSPHTQTAYARYRPRILSILQQGPTPVHQLIQTIDGFHTETIASVIQQMLEDEEVIYDDTLRLTLR